MDKNCILTVVTVSHMHWAAALAESVEKYNPDCDMLVFVLDASQCYLDSIEGLPFSPSVQLIGGDVLCDQLFTNARHYFNAFELSCAAKAFAVEYALFTYGYDKAIFLDSDTFCYARLEPVWEALGTNFFIVTPHITKPFPDDGQSPNDYEMITQGTINGGFWAIKKEEKTRKLLAWLKNKVAHFGFSAHPFMFVDQIWVSYLMSIFPDELAVLRHPGLNVAYWNLQERQLANEGNIIKSNGQPLIFFHYSGFDMRFPTVLTKYSVREPGRKNKEILQHLLEEYAAILQDKKMALPSMDADMACINKNLWGRFYAYRRVYGKTHNLRTKALIYQLLTYAEQGLKKMGRNRK